MDVTEKTRQRRFLAGIAAPPEIVDCSRIRRTGVSRHHGEADGETVGYTYSGFQEILHAHTRTIC